jgi:hypothetical protein
MARHTYKCTNCDTITDRDLLTIKQVRFVEIGVGGKQLKSRNIAWLCPACVARDPVWLLDRSQSTIKSPVASPPALPRTSGRHASAVNKRTTPSQSTPLIEGVDLNSALTIGSKWSNDNQE